MNDEKNKKDVVVNVTGEELTLETGYIEIINTAKGVLSSSHEIAVANNFTEIAGTVDEAEVILSKYFNTDTIDTLSDSDTKKYYDKLLKLSNDFRNEVTNRAMIAGVSETHYGKCQKELEQCVVRASDKKIMMIPCVVTYLACIGSKFTTIFE